MERYLSESPYLSFFAFWILVWAVVQLLQMPFRLWNRVLRHRNIAARGWPPPHLDADGDWPPPPPAPDAD